MEKKNVFFWCFQIDNVLVICLSFSQHCLSTFNILVGKKFASNQIMFLWPKYPNKSQQQCHNMLLYFKKPNHLTVPILSAHLYLKLSKCWMTLTTTDSLACHLPLCMCVSLENPRQSAPSDSWRAESQSSLRVWRLLWLWKGVTPVRPSPKPSKT